MINDFMSSEESDDDNLIVHSLPWRTDYVGQMIERIDKYCDKKKSPQSRRQMKSRLSGSPSSRPTPSSDAPNWAVRN